MKMKNMKESAAASKEGPGAVLDSTEKGPSYPWGLRLNLNHDVLKKLGVKDLPKVGSHIHLHAKAHVASVSSNQSKGGKAHKSVELQIHHMAIGDKEPSSMEEAMSDGIEKANE